MSMPTIREKVDKLLQARGRSIPWLAKELNLSTPSLLYKWLDEEVSPRDANVWDRIAHILNVDKDDLTDPLRQMGYPKNDFRGVHLAEVLLNVLSNPDSTQEDKDVAKYTILQMLKER
jgi:hypothetical protein